MRLPPRNIQHEGNTNKLIITVEYGRAISSITDRLTSVGTSIRADVLHFQNPLRSDDASSVLPKAQRAVKAVSALQSAATSMLKF